MNLQKLILSLTLLFVLSNAYHCSVSVVGSGLSGVYTAYRLASAKDSLVDAEEICLFEATGVIGGRLLPLTDVGEEEEEEGSRISDDVIEMGVETWNDAKMPLWNELVEFLGIAAECAYGEETMETMETSGEGMKREFGRPKTGESQQTQGGRFFKGQEQSQGVSTEQTGTGEMNPAGAEMGEQSSQSSEQSGEMNPAGAEMAGEQSSQSSEQSGDINFAGAEMGEQSTQSTQQTDEVNPAGADMGEVKKCKKLERMFSFLRNRIVYSNFSRVEDTPYNIESLEVIKNFPLHAFMTVLGQYVSNEELESITNDNDAGSRWEKAGEIIRRLASQDITYKGLPIHELSMRMVLQDTLDISEEEIVAAKNLIKEFPHLNSLLSMNFEFFAINHLRDLAAGEGEDKKISKYSGLRTIIDIMATELKEKGVQIYLNSELDFISQNKDDEIVLHFSGSDNVVTTDRLFLAINKKNLLQLTGTDVWSFITPVASEMLGNLKSIGVINGIVFYEDSWWKNFDLTDKSVHTDSVFDTISYFTLSDCVEGEKCPGYIRFRHIADGRHNLHLDISNPIDSATVLSAFVSSNISTEDSSFEENADNSEEPMSEMELTLLRQNLLKSKVALGFLHNHLMSIHKGLPGFDESSIDLPKLALVANWENDGIFEWGTINLPSRIPFRDFIDATIEPFSGLPIHLVNNDFSELSTWKHSLDGSIVSVERVLNYLGMEKPEWSLNNKIYSSLIDLD